MNSLVIVALPAKDDFVNRISSEKVPHMTLLFLGEDATKVKNQDKIIGFVEHAAETSLTRFSMEVDRRDVLGPDLADVVFFSKNQWTDYDKINEYRSYLLKENNIKTAYDSTTQFPEWVPHLTLGYPESPAKPDERDYPGITYVSFDRIAVWFDDYSGIEFPLKAHNWGMDMAMSGTGKVIEDILSHHGTKGMKWGVTRSRAKTAAKEAHKANRAKQRADKKIAKQDKKFERIDTNKSIQMQFKATTHNAIQPVVQSRVYQMNAKPEYAKAIASGRLSNPNDPVAKKYVKEYNKMYINTMNDFLSGFSNASGSRVAKAHLNSESFNGFEIRIENASQVKHADDSMIIKFKYTKDAKGRITNVEILEDGLVQSAIYDIIEHHGIKGMKWGIRKERSSTVSVTDKRKRIKTSGGHGLPAHPDAVRARKISQVGKKSGLKALSNEELQAFNQRLNLEQQAKRLTFNDQSPPKKFVLTLIGQTGKQQASEVTSQVASAQVKKLFNKAA